MKSQKVVVPLPINLEKNELKYFEGKSIVTFSDEKVKILKNVFVSHEGLCAKNGIFIPNSAFNMFGKEDNTKFVEMWKLATQQYFVSHYGKSLQLNQLNGEYLLVYSKWFNYYFWLTSSIYRLIQTEKYHSTTKLLLPKQLSQFKYVMDSLKMFPQLQIEHIEPGIHLKVETLIFPEVRKWTISISPKTIDSVKNKILEYAKINYTLPESIGDKIYLNRKKTGKRGFTNEEEVEGFLLKNDFTSLAFEDYNLFEQALIMEQAQYVIGLHGAGFANIIYMSKGSHLFELIAYPPEIKEHRIGYWRLAGVIGIKYFVQFCDISVDPSVEEILNNDVIVNIDNLKLNIKKMFHG